MKTFAVDDLPCAAAISALGGQLLSTTQDGSRTTFIFSDENGKSSAASIAYVNNVLIPVRDYASAYRELRSVAFASRRSHE